MTRLRSDSSDVTSQPETASLRWLQGTISATELSNFDTSYLFFEAV